LSNNGLSDVKRELLRRLLEQEGVAVAAKITPIKDRDELPLSFAQQRIWFLDQLKPGDPYYNSPLFLSIRGRLNSEALIQILNEIIRRHETLRTTFPTIDWRPIQDVAPALTLTLPIVDLEAIPESCQLELIRNLAREEIERPFHLSTGPLIRVRLLRLNEQNHVLLLTVHHIVCDGWSLGIFCREISAIYEAFSKGAQSSLPELVIQYADFAAWQQHWLQGEVLERQLSYWKEHLKGAPPLLELPCDRPRPAIQSFRGGFYSFTLSTALSDAIRQFSQHHGVTLFMSLLAAVKTLLYRYTGQEDLTIGTTIANRNRAEIEPLIGFFVNTLVLRTRLSGKTSFRELIRAVRVVTLEAFNHQDLPFEKLIEALQPQRALSHNPLFQAEFGLEVAQTDSLNAPGLSLNSFLADKDTVETDFTLTMSESPEGLEGHIGYAADLFDPQTIQRMMKHLEALLDSVVTDPEQRLSEISFLTEAERRQLIEWNSTRTQYPEDVGAHELFEAQADRTPDAVAVVFEEKHLTYRDLNAQTNKLARYLRAIGVGPEVRVGICAQRSLEMVVGLIGILKAGGAYVPIDPAIPSSRLSLILDDIQARVLLTQERFREMFRSHSTQLICMDTDWPAIAQQSENDLPTITTPDNAAYIIYTSGSTGKPKGAVIVHKGLVNYLSWAVRAYDVSGGSGSVVHSTIGFDLTITGLYSPLLVGRKVVLVPEDQEIDGISNVLRRERDLSLIKITPAHLDVLNHRLPPQEASGRTRMLVVGGEALLGESLSFWKNHAPEVRIVNEYGPTETVVGCCVYEFLAGASLTGSVPIGRPIANTQIHLLSDEARPVSIGVVSELYVGGDGLARGYLNASDLTAEKFIPNPFSKAPGARLYKTGDLGRYLPDGNIAFLGRNDQQVKIRGFRIELGEIEAELCAHEAVNEAVITVREDVPGDKRLVAYLVFNQSPAPTIPELRSYLKTRLLDYMIPSTFVAIDALPLTSNGKIDRKLLPAPDGLRPDLGVEYIAPRNDIERTIAAIWQESLRVENIGMHDNFFDRGGYSLLVVEVNSKLRKAFNRDIPLVDMFMYTTVSALAEYLSAGQDAQPSLERSFKRAETRKESRARQRSARNRYQVVTNSER
jgi:amino acid adenylation domain-containing protein